MKDAQDIFLRLGRTGCYFLSLVRADARSPDEIVALYEKCLQSGFITEQCYVLDPVAVHNAAFPFNRLRTVVKSMTLDAAACRVFGHYNSAHFAEVDKSGEIAYNPMPSVRCKKEDISSYRLLYE